MSEYKGIKGFQVTTRTEDPVPFAQAIANNPYAGSWSSGGDLNTGRRSVAAVGTQTANLIAGGDPPVRANAEQYNGSSWTEVGDLNTARTRLGGAGTYTASIAFGGGTGPSNYNASNESWDGSSWTEVGDLNTGRQYIVGVGSSNTAAIGFGGDTPSDTGATETWNGSAWSEGNDLNTARSSSGGAGTSTAAIGFGGLTPASPPFSALTEIYNGSSWTETGDLNTARYFGGGSGTTTAALAIAGSISTGVTGITENFDGSSWTEVADVATARQEGGGSPSGTNTLALYSGGVEPSVSSKTEEWAFTGIQPTDPASGYADAITGDFYYNSSTGQFKQVNAGGAPIGTWASGGTVNSPRTNSQGAGASHSSAIIFSGEGPSVADRGKTESYDGTSWTEVNDLNSPRIYAFGDGTQTAAFAAGGYDPANPNNPNEYRTETETWNGTSWTVLGPANLNTGRAQGGTSGVTTSALAYTGQSPGPNPRTLYNIAEELDGSTWTNISNLNRGPNNPSCSFTSVHLGRTAPSVRVAGGGYDAPNTGVALNEEWNGSSWVEEADLNTARGALVGGSGTVDNCIVFGGGNAWNSPKANTEFWNGTTWTEIADLAAGRAFAGNAGSTATNAMAATGYNYPNAVDTTEEWTAADFEIKTVTTS